jgi:arylformamidase
MKHWTTGVAALVLGLSGTTPVSVFAADASRAGGWVDITAPIDPQKIPIYPGDAPARLDFLQHLDRGGKLTLSAFSMGAHTGTHVDAPMHFIKGGASLDQIPLETFIGPVRIIDCSAEAPAIDAAELNKHDWHGARRIFFRTRNSRKGFMTDPVFHKDFTYLAPDAAKLLADAGVALVGVDYISAEQFGAPEPRTHRALLGVGIPIVEGLLLQDVKPGDYELMLLPMRVIGHEAASARALIRSR